MIDETSLLNTPTMLSTNSSSSYHGGNDAEWMESLGRVAQIACCFIGILNAAKSSASLIPLAPVDLTSPLHLALQYILLLFGPGRRSIFDLQTQTLHFDPYG